MTGRLETYHEQQARILHEQAAHREHLAKTQEEIATSLAECVKEIEKAIPGVLNNLPQQSGCSTLIERLVVFNRLAADLQQLDFVEQLYPKIMELVKQIGTIDSHTAKIQRETADLQTTKTRMTDLLASKLQAIAEAKATKTAILEATDSQPPAKPPSNPGQGSA